MPSPPTASKHNDTTKQGYHRSLVRFPSGFLKSRYVRLQEDYGIIEVPTKGTRREKSIGDPTSTLHFSIENSIHQENYEQQEIRNLGPQQTTPTIEKNETATTADASDFDFSSDADISFSSPLLISDPVQNSSFTSFYPTPFTDIAAWDDNGIRHTLSIDHSNEIRMTTTIAFTDQENHCQEKVSPKAKQASKENQVTSNIADVTSSYKNKIYQSRLQDVHPTEFAWMDAAAAALNDQSIDDEDEEEDIYEYRNFHSPLEFLKALIDTDILYIDGLIDDMKKDKDEFFDTVDKILGRSTKFNNSGKKQTNMSKETQSTHRMGKPTNRIKIKNTTRVANSNGNDNHDDGTAKKSCKSNIVAASQTKHVIHTSSLNVARQNQVQAKTEEKIIKKEFEWYPVVPSPTRKALNPNAPIVWKKREVTR